MTAIPQNRLVSQRIVQPLQQVARRQWSVMATRGVILTLLASLGVILAGVLVLGLFDYVPLWGRITAAVLVWGSVLTAGIAFLRPAMRKRNLVQTAMDVEQRLAESGRADTHERISSSLELQQETDSRFAGSPVLVQHLMRQAEADAAIINAEQVVPAGAVAKLGMLLIPLLALWLFLAMWMPPSKFLRPLFNLLMPWQEPPGFLYDLDVTGSKTYIQGEPIQITLKVNPREQADNDREVARAVMFMLPDGATEPIEIPMARTDKRAFVYSKAAEKSFKYWVKSEGEESQKFVATVEPVPAVEQLSIHYDYPAYTGLAAQTDTTGDGTIQAIVGTKVTISLQSSPLNGASKLLAVEKQPDGKSVNRDLSLQKAAAAGRYETQFVVANSGSYKLYLVNDYKHENKDKDRERAIVATPDEKPQVTITSPAQEMTIRPTETVPVVFQAADDFGIAKLEMVAQVDGGAEMAFPVPLGQEKWPKSFNGKHAMALQSIVEQAKVADASSITYWLRVTDNRDPNPQTAESTRQTFKLDRNAESLAAREQREEAKNLEEAIRIAIRRLEEVHQPVQGFTYHPKLTTDLRKTAEGLKDKLETAGNDLVKESNKHMTDAFATMAVAAKSISETKILGAADSVAKIDLHSDQFDQRKSDAELATKQVVTAKRELEELLKKVEEQARLLDAQHKLEDLAKKQEELNKAMAKADQKNQQQNQQQQLNQKTQEAIQQAQLQDKKQQQVADAAQALLQQIQDLEKQQQAAIEQNQKLAEAQQAQEQAKTLAEKQQELNKKIDEFAKQDQSPLEQAKAQPPEKNALENIVKDLNAQKVQEAAKQQMEAAKKLEQNAEQLKQQAKADQPNAEQQKNAEQAKADAQQAEKAAQEAQQQAEQAKNAEKQANEAGDKAQQAAKQQNKEDQKNAAEKAAEAAKQANALAKAAEKSAQKTQQKAEQAQKNPAAEAKAQEAAKQAGEKAQQAQAAAKEAQEAAEKAENAAQQAKQAGEKGDAQEQQAKTDQAGQQAKQAGQKANEAAQKANEAAQQLAQAQKQNAEQAQAQAKQQSQKQAQAAGEKAEALAQEQRALAQEAAEQAQANAQAQQQQAPSPAQAAAQQQALAQQAQAAAKQAQKLQQMADQAGNQQVAQRAEAAKQALEQAQAAQQQAAQAQKQGNNEQAAGQQEAALNNAARAEQALRGQQPQMAQAQQNAQQQANAQQANAQQGEKPNGEQANGEKPDAAAGEQAAGEQQANAGEKGQGEKGQGEKGQGEKGQGEKGQGEKGQGQAAAAEPHPGEAGQGEAGQGAQQAATPQQALQQAKQAAAEAQAAQQQAAQGNQPAGQQAAQALNQAAQALAQATQGQPGQGQGQAQGHEPGQEPGQDPGQESTPTPGQAADSKQGIAAQAAGGSGELPSAVSELGISASDWAKLGPNQQRELMNAAQQKGPQEYQTMIKNYYIRLARMQAGGNK